MALPRQLPVPGLCRVVRGDLFGGARLDESHRRRPHALTPDEFVPGPRSLRVPGLAGEQLGDDGRRDVGEGEEEQITFEAGDLRHQAGQIDPPQEARLHPPEVRGVERGERRDDDRPVNLDVVSAEPPHDVPSAPRGQTPQQCPRDRERDAGEGADDRDRRALRERIRRR